MKAKTNLSNAWPKLTVSVVLALSLIFTFCNDSNSQTKSDLRTTSNEATVALDTLLDKHIGCYKFLQSSYYIGKFAPDSRVQLSDGKYIPLPKELIGKCFMVKYCSLVGRRSQSLVQGGNVVPEDSGMGNILLGVESNGTIHIQNYSIGNTFGLGGTGTFGKFIKRADGKYDLSADGATYVYQ